MGRGRAPCCDKSKVRAGPWSPAEDLRLINFIQKHGHSNWRALPKQAGLLRCGKSCRLRWINYLRPDVKRGSFTPEEEQTIINLHNSLGNKWSKIASYLPGRTDNEIKNVWNTNLKKRLTGGKVEDANGEAAKDPKRAAVASSSAPQSCTSCSSITTSRDDYTDTTTWLYGIGGGVQDHSEAAENHMKFPESPIEDHIESGGQLTASSSSVYHSTASFYVPSCMQQLEDNNNNMLVLEASESSESRPSSNDHPLEGCADDDRVIQLPTEPDRDFWKLLDSVDPLLDEPTDQSTNYNGENHQEQDAKFDVEEVELNKWLNFLENELGLTSCTTGGDHNQMHIPDEGNKQQDDQIMGNLGPEIIATDHDQTSSDYFPLWPLSPLN